ncbi:MAG TPA: polyamine aminopropyltransferase [Aquifex aeolicus]|uniref:Polyamine aminopropyltransferase n=1 Tax=Aquifex aeolicus TaxID=63363 RepID=A0A9D0YP07_AQUAO|nr:polyamine aminopropyltransferase [Aquificales bacterium]HIP97817.1 polyamine aminopropyltransferase [Aquifex aeolicus]HIQ26331.1 polyamine aminopropyltransferase [Aquifex aeolicus]
MFDIHFFERDPYAPVRHCYAVSKVLYHTKSQYQEILVFENPFFGKILVLDGVVQLTERDEFIYHEMLAHVPLMAHPNPKKVLIIGGGDGGTLREVLKHKSVEEAVLVEIDREVIETSKRFFPNLSESFEDPRAIVVNEDGVKYLQDYENEFDVIIVDSTDPVGFAYVLTTEEFFKTVFRALKGDGIYAGQSESLHYHLDIVRRFQNNLNSAFPIVDLYTAVIPTYAGYWWTFSIASKKYDVRQPKREKDYETKYYSPVVHKNAFLPDELYDKLIIKGEWL